jgi:hypothetical protein
MRVRPVACDSEPDLMVAAAESTPEAQTRLGPLTHVSPCLVASWPQIGPARWRMGQPRGAITARSLSGGWMGTTEAALVCDSETAFAVPSTLRFSGAPPRKLRRKNADCATACTNWNESSSNCCQFGRKGAQLTPDEKVPQTLHGPGTWLGYRSARTSQVCTTELAIPHRPYRGACFCCWFTCLPMYTCSSS